MSERTETKIAKLIACIIIILCVVKIAYSADPITELFMHYNKKQAVYFTKLVNEAGKKYSIDPCVIASIIVVESSARPNVISKGGDYGLMQVRWKVHRDKVKNANDLLQPRINIFVGTRIFAQYYAQKKTLYGALVRYSGGNKKMARRVLATLKKCKQ